MARHEYTLLPRNIVIPAIIAVATVAGGYALSTGLEFQNQASFGQEFHLNNHPTWLQRMPDGTFQVSNNPQLLHVDFANAANMPFRSQETDQNVIYIFNQDGSKTTMSLKDFNMLVTDGNIEAVLVAGPTTPDGKETGALAGTVQGHPDMGAWLLFVQHLPNGDITPLAFAGQNDTAEFAPALDGIVATPAINWGDTLPVKEFQLSQNQSVLDRIHRSQQQAREETAQARRGLT